MKKILASAVILLCLGMFLMWRENNSPKTRERYSISVGDTTLQIIRKLKIGKESSKVLDIRTIHLGKNEYYVQLNENVDLDIIIMK